MSSWPLHEAKAKFSEFLETTLSEGPQVVTRRGVEEAVLVPIEEWKRLQKNARPTLKEVLLGPGAKFDDDFAEQVAKRRTFRLRPPVDLG
jgi:prevent-host-death family protein